MRDMFRYLIVAGLLAVSFWTPLAADDTDIFNKGAVNLVPNVLIIWDTNETMMSQWWEILEDDTFHAPYNPQHDYSVDIDKWNAAKEPDLHKFETNAVYSMSGLALNPDSDNDYSWNKRSDTIDSLECGDTTTSIKEDLLDHGFAGQYRVFRVWCKFSGDSVYHRYYVRSGNFLNWLTLQGQNRFDTVKVALDSLFALAGTRVNFALMLPNLDDPYDQDETYPVGRHYSPREILSDPNLEAGTYDIQPDAAWTIAEALFYPGLFIFDTTLMWRTNSQVDAGRLYGPARDDLFRNFQKNIDYNSKDFDLRADGTHGGVADKRLVRGNWLNWYRYSGFDSDISANHRDSVYAGGRIIAPFIDLNKCNQDSDLLSTHNESIRSSLSGISAANPHFMASEMLAEAALYFSGGGTSANEFTKSWANADCYYPQPSDYQSLSFKHAKKTSDQTDSRPSPVDPAITWRCQKNFVIVIADSEPSEDGGNRYGQNVFTRLGVGNKLKDVAAYLYRTDILPEGKGSLERTGPVVGDDGGDNVYKVQNVMTYTVALSPKKRFSSLTYDRYNPQYLKDAAMAGSGLTDSDSNKYAHYYEVNTLSDLQGSLMNIMNDIYEVCSGYAASVIPVDTENFLMDSNSVYLPLFQPSFDSRWLGNLKKYAIGPDGQLYDRRGEIATIAMSGGRLMFSREAQDIWDTKAYVEPAANDPKGYASIKVGGAGQVLIEQAKKSSRKVYTVKKEKPSDTTGKLTEINIKNIFDADLEVGEPFTLPSGQIVKVSAEEVIKLVVGDPNATEQWMMGDIMHSDPVMVRYSTNKNANFVFVGANDGSLHAFKDTVAGPYFDADGKINKANIDSSANKLEELWAFVPTDQLKNLKYLHGAYRAKDAGANIRHRFFVDATPLIFNPAPDRTKSFWGWLLNKTKDEKHHLVVGRGRGGKGYSCLDISTEADLEDGPDVLWEIGEGFKLWPKLGQSWGTPRFGTVKTVNGDKNVLLMAGGYDTNQDLISPNAADSYGALVYAVYEKETQAASTTITSPEAVDELTFETKDSSGFDANQRCIVNMSAFDFNADNHLDTIYAGDLGGRLFGFTQKGARKNAASYDVAWDSRLIFKGPSQLKFFYAPDIVLEFGFDYIFIGSGDKEHPTALTTSKTDHNRFYAIKNAWNSAVLPLKENTVEKVAKIGTDEDGLIDITDSTTNDTWRSKYGWYIRLEDKGEKVVSSPLTYHGVVYFTTYTPVDPTTVKDVCARPKLGIARLYALNYKNGNYHYNWFEEDTDTAYDTSELNDKRSLVLGEIGLPPQPVVRINKNGPLLIIGNRAIALDAPKGVNRHYWTIL